MTEYPLKPSGNKSQIESGGKVAVVTDPLLRRDPFWSAMERSIIALTEEPQILYEKKHDWQQGLNSQEINRLASETGLSPNPVFAQGEDIDEGHIQRWLKVFHPELDEPIKVVTWDKIVPVRRTSPARLARMVAYLRAWQEKRAEQLRLSANPTITRSKAVGKKHVFLSYCHDDSKEVSQLREDLIAAGEKVWWDREILGGQDWQREIRKAMKEAYAVIACFSTQTDARSESGIFPELFDAIKAYRQYTPGSIFLIPVRLSECSIPDVEISDTKTLDSLQYIDLFPPSKRNDGFQRLI